MLGVPGSPGAAGFALLVLGVALAVAVGLALRRRRGGALREALAVCLLATLAATPFLVWRIVEDIRYTTALDASTRDGAGPVQAFLQPYLLDNVPRIVPRGATYATATGARVPYATARKAFPALAQNVLFPRVSAPVRDADWIVAWGIDPRRVAPVRRVVVARPASGVYPAVLVGEVLR